MSLKALSSVIWNFDEPGFAKSLSGNLGMVV